MGTQHIRLLICNIARGTAEVADPYGIIGNALFNATQALVSDISGYGVDVQSSPSVALRCILIVQHTVPSQSRLPIPPTRRC
jgi:predicted methyltransferase MtxX (methanogen marker protein 4)